MCSCTLFFRCRSYSPWWQLVFPPFLTAAIKFLCFSSNEIGLLGNVDIEIKSKGKNRLLLLLVLSLKGREAMRFTAETRGCLKCKISSWFA